MIDTLLQPFTFPFMRDAFLICLIVAPPTALLSCFLVLKGWALMGDAVSHAVLPGIVLAYIAGFLIFANYDFTGQIRHWIEYPAFFVAGSWIALHNDWFMRNGKRILLIAGPILLIIYFFTPLTATARFFLIPLFVIYIGNLPAKESWFTRLGDPSYGIYLYGFPIAQSVIAVAPKLNFWVSLSLALILAIMAGYASWLLLESRALRLKNLFGQRTSKPVVSQ